MSLISRSRSLFPELRHAFRMLEEPFAPSLGLAARDLNQTMGMNKPAVDVHETADGYTVEAELPGIHKQDVKLSFDQDGQTLTLSGNFEKSTTHQSTASETTSESTQTSVVASESKTPVWSERVFGNFARSLRFPNPIDTQSAEAKMEDGVLRVKLTKRLPSAAEQIVIQ